MELVPKSDRHGKGLFTSCSIADWRQAADPFQIFFAGSETRLSVFVANQSENPERWWETAMPSNSKFPSTAEIKRVIAAASRAGIEIGSIEIHTEKITIRSRVPTDQTGLSEYDLWKLSHREDTDRVKHSDEQSDALPKKPRG